MTSAHECVHCLILNYKPAPYTQMQLLGMISNSMNGFTSPEDLFPASGEAMSEYELLYCFRRDSDKVQNYLKILKCRIVPDHGCWVPLTCTAGPHIILSVHISSWSSTIYVQVCFLRMWTCFQNFHLSIMVKIDKEADKKKSEDNTALDNYLYLKRFE